MILSYYFTRWKVKMKFIFAHMEVNDSELSIVHGLLLETVLKVQKLFSVHWTQKWVVHIYSLCISIFLGNNRLDSRILKPYTAAFLQSCYDYFRAFVVAAVFETRAHYITLDGSEPALCRPGWSCSHRNPPASAFGVLRLTTLG